HTGVVGCNPWAEGSTCNGATSSVCSAARRPRGRPRHVRSGWANCRPSGCAELFPQRERLWWSRTASLAGLLLSPRQPPVASRGVWVVAAPCCAATPSPNAERSANEPDRQRSEVSLYGTSHQTAFDMFQAFLISIFCCFFATSAGFGR